MKTLLIFLLAFAGAQAFATEPSDRPIGIEPDNWIAVTEKLGFVVVIDDATSPPIQGTVSSQLLLNKVAPDAPATGFFMIKTADGWRRIIVMTPTELAPAVKD